MVFEISKAISLQVVQVASHFFLHLNLSEFHPTHPGLVLAITRPVAVGLHLGSCPAVRCRNINDEQAGITYHNGWRHLAAN
jgi:hypothetical protein